ncbi:hypothetical protein F5146DRAFT_517552 [Armillaria mellea]|nr:hypothetical protein F5146DRAFT_517552 [Armillaria mellea]
MSGIYTGILAVALWNIFTNKCWPTRRVMTFVIIFLYALISLDFVTTWSYVRSAFIKNGTSFWTISLNLGPSEALAWVTGISSFISTILADLYMIWCCWMVWGRHWLIVLLPVLSLISATVSRVFEISNTSSVVFQTLYISFNLATTLFCTLLIIYRILIVPGATRRGAEARLRVFHRLVEVLVESSALYSISLIPYLVFTIRDLWGSVYLDVIAAIAKGIAPTLLVGRVAAGYTRPDDDRDESTLSTLHFQPPLERGTTSLTESTTQTSVVEIDIEAQQQ